MIERFAIIDRSSWLAMRSQDLTASDIGAVIGVDPYRSALRVYAEKAGEIGAEGETNIMRRGRWLEAATLEALREELPGWRIERAGVYLRDPDVRLGGTPDALAEDPEHPERLLNVQMKVVSRPAYERDWADGPPLGYQLQTLAEGFLLDADRSLLAALVIDTYSADVFVHEVPRHAAAEQKIREIAAEFWQNIAAGRRPVPDYGKDADTIAAMFPRQEPGKVLDLTGDNRLIEILPQREFLKDRIDGDRKQLEALDAEVKYKLGDAETAELPGWRLTFREEHRKEYTVAASSRRVLRVKQIEQKDRAA